MDKVVKSRWETKIKELEEELKTCNDATRARELLERIGRIRNKIGEKDAGK